MAQVQSIKAGTPLSYQEEKKIDNIHLLLFLICRYVYIETRKELFFD
jgi:hypothetical protein